jgi:PKD repeat protein
MQLPIFEKDRYFFTPMRLTKIVSWIILCMSISVVQVCRGQSIKNFQLTQPFSFEENKGQLTDHNILYYGKSKGTNVYLFKDHIAFVFEKAFSYKKHKPETIPHKGKFNDHRNDSIQISTARIGMSFVNANVNVQIIQQEPQKSYNSYYLPQCPDGVTAHSFNKIIYKDIYPQIDLVLNAKDDRIEYAFNIHPGGNVSDIKLQWGGNDSLRYDEVANHIRYANNLGFLTESSLTAYGKNNRRVECRYKIEGNTIAFEVGDYDKSKVLIIDPEIIWATYYASGSLYDGDAVSIDSGNVYLVGYSNSAIGLGTSGAFSTSNAGGYDAFIAKFSSSGSRLWGTYFGGKGGDGATSSAIDNKGNIYIVGSTDSDTGLATAGAFQTRKQGLSSDAFIAKFSSLGKRLWSTYYGYQAGAYGICTDKNGNVAIVGECVVTDSRFYKYIATSGAYQTKYGGGILDAFVAKFSSTGSRLWSTFYGGPGEESSQGIVSDSSGNLIMTGYVYDSSSDTILATKGAYQTKLKGDYDAFITKFSSSGSLLWSTYYGTANTDLGNAVATDKYNNIYATGLYSGNVFIAKFSSAGNFYWNTLFGGNGGESGYAIRLDSFSNIYVTGNTNSTTGIATKDAPQKNYGGSYDAFIARFSPSGKRIWSSYLGGTGSDIGYGIEIDSSKYAYICGTTTSTSNIATNGAFQTSLTGSWDDFLAKFNYLPDNDAGVTSVIAPKKAICPGKSFVTVKLKNYGLKELDTVHIAWSLNHVLQPAYKWTGKLKPDSTTSVSIDTFKFISGYDTIRAWTYLPNNDSDVVPENDSSKASFFVYPSPVANAGGNHSICYGGRQIGSTFDSSLHYSWTSRPPGFNDSVAIPAVRPTVTTTYYLTVTNKVTGCSATDSAVITVMPLPVVKTGPRQTICLGDSATLGDSAIVGYGYMWFKLPLTVLGTSSTLRISPASTTTYYLQVTNLASGCTRVDSVMVKVISFAANAGKSHSTCYESGTVIGAAPVARHKYQWTSKPVGFTSTQSNPAITPKVNTTYYLTETDTLYGCSHSDSVTITVNPLPTPNAGRDTVICAGSYVVLGSTQPVRYSYSWTSLPTGFTSTDRAVSVSPTDSTRYIVTATDSNGCSNTDTVIVKVNSLPKAYIGAKAICPGDSIQLGASPIAGHTYQWVSSIGGFSSTLPNPVVRPTTATTYFLNETNTATGCSKGDSATVFINPVPKAANVGNKTICSGDKIAIGAVAVVGSNYTWTSKPLGFASNSSNPIVSPAVTTTYYLTETNASGCVKSDSLTLTVKPIPAKPFAGKDQRICAGDTVTLSFSPANGNIYRWTSISSSFSSTDSVVQVNPAVTTAYVLTNTSTATGCRNSDTVVVKVIALPIPKIKGQLSFCGINAATYTTPFQDSTNYEWTISNGKILSGQSTNSVSVQWLDTGAALIRVKEINSNGCSYADSATIRINQKPKALFSGNNVCQGESIQFTDSSKFASAYAWSFGDGSTSTLQNPEHQYSKSGTYSIKEVIRTQAGCTDSFIRTINVYTVPKGVLRIIHDTGRLYSFAITDSTEYAYHWDFGDGDSSNLNSTKHSYHNSKAYNVRLTIRNSNGCIVELDTTINSFYYADKDSISIFPNPFAGHISIYERLKENTSFRLLIYDVIGQKVADISQWTRDAGIHTDLFDATGLAQGTYIVKLIVGDDEVIVKKMVKVGE